MKTHSFWDNVMLAVAIACPVVFFLACRGLFLSEGGMTSLWGQLGAILAPVGVLGAGPAGFLAAVFLLLRNIKRRKYKIILNLGLLLLLLLNLFIILPVYCLIMKIF